VEGNSEAERHYGRAGQKAAGRQSAEATGEVTAMFEIVIDNKNGSLWDITSLVSDVSWKTSRIGKASSLNVTFVKDSPFQSKSFTCNPGDVIRVKKDGINLFYGYVFVIDQGNDDEVKLTAYDQIRYLTASDTYVFKNATAAEVIAQIAKDTGMAVGTLTDTVHRIPSMVEDGQKLLDIIYKALDATLMAKNEIYVFYDDAGELTLKSIRDLTVDMLFGEGSLMYEFSHQRSIDGETYNRIKMVQDNKETGKRDVYIVQDSANIAKWGRLQHYQKADDKLNSAQIREILDRLIQLKNREQKTLRIGTLGKVGVRAGSMVRIHVKEMGIKQFFLVEECTHTFAGDDHTMTLELKVI
jgi:hypothetical protein